MGEAARSRLTTDASHHAPELVDLEVVSVLRRLLRLGTIDQRRAAQAVEDLERHPLRRYSHEALLGRVWGLRDNLSPYDAAYVALAEVLEATLVTADAGLAGAPGPRCRIEVLA